VTANHARAADASRLRPLPTLFVIATIVAGSTTPALADEDARRLGLSGRIGHARIEAFDTEGSTTAYGAGASLSVGLRNWVEVGIDASYLTRPNIILADATLAGITLASSRVYANLHYADITAHVRFTTTRSVAHRLRPFLALRAGLGLRVLANPELFDQGGGFVTGANADTSFFPVGGPETGITWQAGDRWQFAIAADTLFGSRQRVLGLHLEASWLSFDLF
jgi:hypothetical protein